MSGHPTAADRNRIKELDTRLRDNPSDVLAMIEMGALLFEPFHKPNEAARILRAAIQKDPQSSEARFWLAKCLIHELFEPDQAKRVLEEALSLDPSRADCLHLMATAMKDLGAVPTEYVAYLTRAVKSAPEWINPRIDLARALIALGRLDEAEAELTTALNTIATVNVSPRGSLEEYYEAAVTGRTNSDARHTIDQLMVQLRRRKTRETPHSTSPGTKGQAD